MEGRRNLLCQLIGLVLSVVLLGGCESGQQTKTSWQQEKLELQETIEAQYAEIHQLKRSEETVFDILSDVSDELIKCQKQIAKTAKVERDKKIIKKSKEFKPEELKKRLAELKAMRETAAEHMKEKAAAEAGENQAGQSD